MKTSDREGSSSNSTLQAQHCCGQTALCDIVIHLDGQYDADELINLIIVRAAGFANTEHGFFYQYDLTANVLELKRAVGLFSEHIGYRVKQGVGLTGKVLQTGQPMAVNDYQSWKGRDPDPRWNRIRAISAFPLMFKGQVVGEIGLVHTEEGRRFEHADMTILTRFAALANTTLARARLSAQVQHELAERKRIKEELQHRDHQLKEAFSAIINALASTIEMKDPYTAAHQRWVTQLACAIADEMGLGEEQIEGLRMAGLIHDIGKMNVSTEFLIKPGLLSEIEYETVKVHPQSGYDIIKEIPFPWPVAQIVLQHHERMDGSGYPQGISGEEILLEARILAVADVVEAMGSHRPYRDAHGLEIALKEIAENRGVLYDPEVVDACLKVFAEKGFTFE
jgi:putative nucleotidyltransferase with HDIG domain